MPAPFGYAMIASGHLPGPPQGAFPRATQRAIPISDTNFDPLGIFNSQPFPIERFDVRCFTDVLSLTIANSTKTYDTRHLP
jgi:hypothetical protein